MLKTWLFALAVVVVGGLAGVAIAGRPEPVDPFVLDPNVTVPIEPSATTEAVSTTTTSRTTTTTTPSTTTSTTSPAAAPTTIVIPATTTSTTDAATTTEPATTTTVAGPLPRDQVRLVLANGDGRFRLASITADRIRPLGYVIDLGDALKPVDATIIYYRPGFQDEAAVVATDIKVPAAIIAALPTNSAQAITNSDDLGDLIVVLGPDAPR
jgi:hypothetical protein